MTLDEAIKHSEDKVKELSGCECSKEHEQLANWLKELKQYKENDNATNIVECKAFNCENYKDGKCMLKKVRMVVIENELECEDANEPTNVGVSYI